MIQLRLSMKKLHDLLKTHTTTPWHNIPITPPVHLTAGRDYWTNPAAAVDQADQARRLEE
jgi:hypothetical protein